MFPSATQIGFYWVYVLGIEFFSRRGEGLVELLLNEYVSFDLRWVFEKVNQFLKNFYELNKSYKSLSFEPIFDLNLENFSQFVLEFWFDDLVKKSLRSRKVLGHVTIAPSTYVEEGLR